MKVKDLIKELKNLDQNIEVIVSDFDMAEGEHGFCHVKTVKQEAVDVGDEDKEFAYIYPGDWL